MKKGNAFLSAVGLVAAVLLATPAVSIVYLMQTDEEMLRQSPVIVYGRVIGTAPARLDDRPATDAQVRVEKVLKGRLPGSVVTVRQPGGVDGGRLFQMMGLPMLSGGDRVLLFLEEHEEVHRTVGLGLGIFFEASHMGRRILVREAPHLASGGVAEERRVRDSALFRLWIADRVQGRESRADYFAAERPDRPRAVASPYTLDMWRCYDTLPPPSLDELPLRVLRWREFDTGGTVSFRVYGHQAGISAGDADDATKAADSLAAVKTAMSAWNGAAAGVSLAAATGMGDPPPNFFARGAWIFLDEPTTTPPALALATGVAAADCDRPGRHTIPGTDVKALANVVAKIETYPLLASSLALIADGAVNDFVEVITHELGHALGLDHSADPSALMSGATVIDGRNPGLGTDDVNGINYLYPVTGGARPSPPPAPGPDPEPSGSDCTLSAPYWSGPTGGFTVRPAPGRNSVSLTCGGRTTEYMAEDGLVTRLVESSCGGSGLQLTGAAVGGWYWQHGDRNAAVAPLVCPEALGGPSAVVPGGVTTDVTDDGTLFRHDTAQMIGIVPHLAGNDCGEYVTPYWQGDGGFVVRPAEGGETVRVRVQCGRTYSTMTPSAGEDGVIAELVRKSYCTDHEGNPKQGRLTVTGAAPGGWYWISGERNAAAAPLMCADLLGGPAAVDPGGVTTRATEDGTYFKHDTSRLIGVVPHLAPDAEDD